MSDGRGSQPGVSPDPSVQQKWRLYDRPLRRDWIFWMTVFWPGFNLVVLGSVLASGKSTPLIGAVLTAVLLAVFLGLIPACIRRWLRRFQYRRHLIAEKPEGTATVIAPSRATSAQPGRALPQSDVPNETSFSSPKVPAAQMSVEADFLGLHAANQWDIEGEFPLSPLTDKFALPFPVASALREVQRAQSSREQYDAMLRSAEALAIAVCVTAAALLRARRDPLGESELHLARTRSLSSLRSSFFGRPATFGTWTNWLSALAARTAGYPVVSPEFDGALPDSDGAPGLVTCLNTLRDERNRAAHGDAPHSDPEAALRVSRIGSFLQAAVQKSTFLESCPWLLTNSCNYRPRSDDFEVSAYLAMGDHPEFDVGRYTFKVPLGTDMFYTVDHDEPIAISPLLARRFCISCQSLEVCYVAHVGKEHGPATLHSFNRGHEIADLDLGVEIRDFFVP